MSVVFGSGQTIQIKIPSKIKLFFQYLLAVKKYADVFFKVNLEVGSGSGSRTIRIRNPVLHASMNELSLHASNYSVQIRFGP